MGHLEGRTMVITGAGQGLGRTMTRRFVAEGARVIAAARNLERLQEAIAPLGDEIDDAGDVLLKLDLLQERIMLRDVLAGAPSRRSA